MKCYKRLIRFKKAKKIYEEGIKEEVACSTIYQSIKQRVKQQRADQVVEDVTHIPEQIVTTKRVSAAKCLKFTEILYYSGNISVSSTPTRLHEGKA